ncbi:hypothetical protein NE237_019828 [Protea cynaroides]|uniref:Uncharacterized protein n=1 Tax=Protea cynaroides TaxID=273540 RepID=A0A9Q0H7W9_9MAGN|nr:hypothetical protein NE237_019828 [Protea cynaroides]
MFRVSAPSPYIPNASATLALPMLENAGDYSQQTDGPSIRQPQRTFGVILVDDDLGECCSCVFFDLTISAPVELPAVSFIISFASCTPVIRIFSIGLDTVYLQE